MIYNETAKKQIIKKHVVCRNTISKGFGLMFRKNPDYGMIFEFNNERKISLTMWFVFYPIDVLWLNKDKRVVEIKKNFMPFTNYTPFSKANFVIELPVGQLDNTKLGDKILWK